LAESKDTENRTTRSSVAFCKPCPKSKKLRAYAELTEDEDGSVDHSQPCSSSVQVVGPSVVDKRITRSSSNKPTPKTKKRKAAEIHYSFTDSGEDFDHSQNLICPSQEAAKTKQKKQQEKMVKNQKKRDILTVTVSSSDDDA
jgi:hypothetical protein